MVRFYGFSGTEIESMDLDSVESYWQAMSVISSNEMLLQLRASDFPHLKEKDRSKLWRSFEKQSIIKDDSEPELTTDAVRERLGKILNG